MIYLSRNAVIRGKIHEVSAVVFRGSDPRSTWHLSVGHMTCPLQLRPIQPPKSISLASHCMNMPCLYVTLMSLLCCLFAAALRLKLAFAIRTNHPLYSIKARFYLSIYIMQQVNTLKGQKEAQRKRRLPHYANNRPLREETPI